MRPRDRPLENDFISDDDFALLLRAWFGQMARVLEPGRGFYIWGGYANLGNYPPALKESGLYFSQGIVWDKEHPVLTRKDFMGAFEICSYGWREGADALVPCHPHCVRREHDGCDRSTPGGDFTFVAYTPIIHRTTWAEEGVRAWQVTASIETTMRRGPSVLSLTAGSARHLDQGRRMAIPPSERRGRSPRTRSRA